MLFINRWYIKNKPYLSLRRLTSLIYLYIKRSFGLDFSFQPIGKGVEKIDIFMPVVEKDYLVLSYSINMVRKNSLHKINNIYIVGPKSSKKIKKIAKDMKCIFVAEESVLPFDKEKINYVYKGYDRNGWIYKMLMNLYADTICSENNILILDADTLFISPQIFIYKNKPLFNLSDEYNEPYYDANYRILGVKHRNSRSFITHYMLFNSDALKKMRTYIENKHGEKWFKVIIENIVKDVGSGFADYEIYGDYYTQIYKKPFILNYWSNISMNLTNVKDIGRLVEGSKNKYRSLSLHVYKEKY